MTTTSSPNIIYQPALTAQLEILDLTVEIAENGLVALKKPVKEQPRPDPNRLSNA